MEENPSVKPIGSAAPAGGQRSLTSAEFSWCPCLGPLSPSAYQLTTLSVLCDFGKFVKRKVRTILCVRWASRMPKVVPFRNLTCVLQLLRLESFLASSVST